MNILIVIMACSRRFSSLGDITIHFTFPFTKAFSSIRIGPIVILNSPLSPSFFPTGSFLLGLSVPFCFYITPLLFLLCSSFSIFIFPFTFIFPLTIVTYKFVLASLVHSNTSVLPLPSFALSFCLPLGFSLLHCLSYY